MILVKLLKYIVWVISFFISLANPCGAFDFEGLTLKLSQQYKKGGHKIVLKNGMTFLLFRRKASPTVTLYIRNRGGSVYDRSDQIGTAHMLEHMMSKGTEVIGTRDYKKEKVILKSIFHCGSRLDALKKRLHNNRVLSERDKMLLDHKIKAYQSQLHLLQKKHRKWVIYNEVSKIYNLNGANHIKAHTSKDSSQYNITLAPQSLELWAKIESDRMQNLVLRGFYKERDVILEERLKAYMDNPVNLLKETLLQKAFPDSPYGSSNIGTDEEIQALTPPTLKAFYKDYYVPNNYIITIVGNFNPKRIRKIIYQYFSVIPPGRRAKSIKMTAPKVMKKKVCIIEGESSLLMVGFYVPPVRNPSTYPLHVIKTILIRSTRSRLYRSLVAKGLAHFVRIYSLPGVKSSHLFTIVVKAKRNIFIKSIEKIIFSEILMLKKIQKHELLRAKYYIYDDFIRDLSSDIALAGDLSYFEDVYTDWKSFFDDPDRIKHVTLKDIQKVTSQYLIPENSVVGIMRSSH